MTKTTIEGIIAKDSPIKQIRNSNGSRYNVYKVPYHPWDNPEGIDTFKLITLKPLSIKESEKMVGTRFRLEQNKTGQVLVYDINGKYSLNKFYSTRGCAGVDISKVLANFA